MKKPYRPKLVYLALSLLSFGACIPAHKEPIASKPETIVADTIDSDLNDESISHSESCIEIDWTGTPHKVSITQVDSTTLQLFFQQNDSLTIRADKLLFPVGYLYSQTMAISSYTDMQVDESNTLVITQEYGSASPQGWYSAYITYKPQSEEIMVDSIVREWKNFEAFGEDDFIQKEVTPVNNRIEDCDILKIYNLK